MKNAKEEFKEICAARKLICAEIYFLFNYGEDRYEYKLKIGYTNNKLIEFMDSLNFEYDSGYGIRQLYGTIWFEDGVWAEREEYDGSEWWKINSYPIIPEDLK